MNTAEDLKKEFGTRFPRLEMVTEKFLGLTDKRTIYRDYEKGKIPFPAFKMTKSAKAPFLVDVFELAKYVDQQALSAKESR